MKNIIKNLIFLMALFVYPSIQAQTLDEILNNYFEVAGQNKVLEKNEFITNGKILQGGVEIPFTSYHKRPLKFKSDAVFQGMRIVQAFDGENGWSINPFAGSNEPQPMTEEQADKMKLQADFDGVLYNYKEKGNKLELIGKEELDDIEVYLLKLTRKNGDEITFYMDAENYVVLKTKSKMKIQGVERESETIFSNYKYVDEILSPFELETKINGNTVMQMVFEGIDYKVEVPDSIFNMPKVIESADSIKK